MIDKLNSSTNFEIEQYRGKKAKTQEKSTQESIFAQSADGVYNKSEEYEQKNIHEFEQGQYLGYGEYDSDNYWVNIDTNGDGVVDERKISNKNTGEIIASFEDKDQNGSNEIYKKINKDGSVSVFELNEATKKYDFREVKDITINADGEIGDFNQGEIGDCDVLGAIKSISNTKEGKEAIKNAIKEANDGWTVHFEADGGLEISVSKDELLKAKASGKYSVGDDDVILLEIAYEKYCDENNTIIDKWIGVAGKIINEIKDPRSIDGKSFCDFTKAFLGKGAKSTKADKKSLDKIKNNDSVAATLGFKNRTKIKDINGNVVSMAGSDKIIASGHAWAVKEITDDTVTIVNPWDTSVEYTFKREDIEKANASLEYLQLDK